jgi:hypothetical protein|tara:strand:+ start:2050 stop:2364 length:315 start_codon:yes stop_codon:yes gene_type:complete
MNKLDLPIDSIAICVSLSEEGNPVTIGFSNLSKSLPEVEKDYLNLILKGIEFLTHASPEGLASIGNLSEMVEAQEDAVLFEPDEELTEAIEGAKVIPINKNRMN